MANDERLREALDRLKNAFCGCDVMRGYTCGIHAHIVAIEQAAAPEPQTASFVPTKNGIRKSNELCSTKFRDLWGDECDCDRDKGHIGSHSRWVKHVESAAPEPQPVPSPAGGAQHDIQRGQYVWVKGVVVGGDQPRDFPKRARIHVYGIGTGIPKEFKPVTEASQPSPAAAGERALREALERLVNAVRTLGKISKRDGRTLFESPPSKDKDSLNAWLELNEAQNAWLELNEAQKVARETLASQPAQPEQP